MSWQPCNPLHICLLWNHHNGLIYLWVTFFKLTHQWKRHVRSQPIIGIPGSLSSSSQHSNRFVYYPLWLHINLSQNNICIAPSSYCISQHARTLQYLISYAWHGILVQSFKCFMSSNMIHEVSVSPLITTCFTSSTPSRG